MTPTSINPMNPITEDDIADFLANTPDFFQRHAQLLSSVHLLSPDNHRSVSLQERQAQMLRDKIRALEMRIMDMIRHGNENMIITEKLQKWACELLQTPASERVPSALKNIEIRFQVPQVSVRLWGVADVFKDAPYAQVVTAEVKEAASSYASPFVGAGAGIEAVQWLQEPAQAASVALLPLRLSKDQTPFGLLVLASPDAQRFQSGMGTDFLEHLGELCSATHVRRWVVQMHSGGRSGRGIALILSGWRGFYHWLARENLIAHNPVEGVRAPKVSKPLPKALGVDEAVQLAEHSEEADDPWLEARDVAMVELLYGCGLRVTELTGLDVVASSEAAKKGRGWIDLQSAEVMVQGKGGKRRTVPLGQAALKALELWLPLRSQALGMMTQSVPGVSDAALALFPGRHGTRLTAQSVWQRLKRRSLLAGMATPVHPHMLFKSC